MKIRTDFVTNSSSSSFVTYKLNNSAFCKYLTEQMEKNNFKCEDWVSGRPASYLSIDENSLDADIACSQEGLHREWYDEMDSDEWEENYRNDDIDTMMRKFLNIMGEFVDFSKVDDPAKLYDAFLDDLKNDRLECDVYMGCTD